MPVLDNSDAGIFSTDSSGVPQTLLLPWDDVPGQLRVGSTWTKVVAPGSDHTVSVRYDGTVGHYGIDGVELGTATLTPATASTPNILLLQESVDPANGHRIRSINLYQP